jgi:hypothetical protein
MPRILISLNIRFMFSLMVCLTSLLSFNLTHAAEEAGKIKTLQGQVSISRADKLIPAAVGTPVFSEDTLITGQDGSVGITLSDGTRLTAGKNSKLKLNQFSYNPTTHAGAIDASLDKGVMAVISGKIAKTSPKTVQFRTQHSIIGVRGTEFIIEAGESL